MCALEFPDLESEIWRAFDDDVVVLGLSGGGVFLTESWGTVNQFREQTGVTFPLLLADTTRGLYSNGAGNISPFPLDVIVDRHGTIRYLGREYDPKAMVALLEQLVAQ